MESQQHALEILMDLRRLVAAHGEFLAKFGQHTEEAPESLAERSPPHQPWNTRPPDQKPVTGPQRGWSLPPSVTTAPLGIKPEALPRLRLEPPRFDGEHALDWIGKIQSYYNHHYTPLDDRLYLTQYLFDHPASDWREYWVETNKGKSWDDFLLAVKHRFDPEFYKPYAATVSFGPFRRTGGTSRDQRQPIRTTANPIANQDPDSQPLHRIGEVKQTIMVVKEHNADGDLIDQTCSEALHMASEIIVGDDIKGVGYDAEQVAQIQALTEPILPREVSTDRVDFDDSISADVSTCESNIFCGNYENLVSNTPFVEKKVLEFNELDVCFDGAEGLKVENGIKDLVVCDNEGLKYCCSGDCLELPKFLDGEWSCAILQFGGDIGVHVFDPGIFESDDIDAVMNPRRLHHDNIMFSFSADADWSLWRLRQWLGDFRGHTIAIRISHLEDKVDFNRGRVDRAPDLVNLVKHRPRSPTYLS